MSDSEEKTTGEKNAGSMQEENTSSAAEATSKDTAQKAQPAPEPRPEAAKPAEAAAAPAEPAQRAKSEPAAQKPAPAKAKAGRQANARRTGNASRAKSVKAAAGPARAPATSKVEKSLPKPTVNELKEKIMDTAPQADYTKFMGDAMTEMQSRAKNAYERSTEVAGEMTDLARGNAEAFVETGRVLAGGMQELGKTYVDEAKTAYETMTGDLKEMAAIKSPTELFQLQSRLMRRNFDMIVAYNSKNSEAMLKLANDAFAPLSGRISAATEKMSKAG